MIEAIARSGDRAAFARLFEYYAPRIKAYLMRGGCEPGQAEELAQEAMLAVWRKAGQFDTARAGAPAWIFAIARNLRVDALRRERPAPDHAADMAEPPQPDAACVQAEASEHLRQALADLPPEQARVVRAAYFDDQAHSEIAEELGLPLGTVKSRLRLALQRLRARLETLQ